MLVRAIGYSFPSLEDTKDPAMTSTFEHPTMEEMDLYLRRARHARSQALADTGHWLSVKIRAAIDAILHPHHPTPHGPAAA